MSLIDGLLERVRGALTPQINQGKTNLAYKILNPLAQVQKQVIDTPKYFPKSRSDISKRSADYASFLTSNVSPKAGSLGSRIADLTLKGTPAPSFLRQGLGKFAGESLVDTFAQPARGLSQITDPQGAKRFQKSSTFDKAGQLADISSLLPILPVGRLKSVVGGSKIANTVDSSLIVSSLKRSGIAARIGKVVDVASLKFPEYAKGGIKPETVRGYIESLRTGGKINPIVVDEAGNVLDGAHRLQALKALGITKVPTVIQKTGKKPATLFQFIKDQGGKFAGSTRAERLANQRGSINFGAIFGKGAKQPVKAVQQAQELVEGAPVSSVDNIPQNPVRHIVGGTDHVIQIIHILGSKLVSYSLDLCFC